MNYLIDTHAIIWHLNEYDKLSNEASNILDDPKMTKFISQASLIELSIKMSLGKIKLQCDWDDLLYYFNKAGWTIIPFHNVDFITLSTLTLHHGDPFDRLMACQAINQKLQLISKDSIFDTYGVDRIW
jgi:PIN domain nuclease of toxin-antitoxin system